MFKNFHANNYGDWYYLRYGHHNLAAGMYGVLSWRVCSDQQHFWVSALAEVSRGEASPAAPGDRADNLTAANTHLHRALSALKVIKVIIWISHFRFLVNNELFLKQEG